MNRARFFLLPCAVMSHTSSYILMAKISVLENHAVKNLVVTHTGFVRSLKHASFPALTEDLPLPPTPVRSGTLSVRGAF